MQRQNSKNVLMHSFVPQIITRKVSLPLSELLLRFIYFLMFFLNKVKIISRLVPLGFSLPAKRKEVQTHREHNAEFKTCYNEMFSPPNLNHISSQQRHIGHFHYWGMWSWGCFLAKELHFKITGNIQEIWHVCQIQMEKKHARKKALLISV